MQRKKNYIHFFRYVNESRECAYYSNICGKIVSFKLENSIYAKFHEDFSHYLLLVSDYI